LNLAVRSTPAYLTYVSFDLIIFHTTFLSNRWIPSLFEELCEKARPLKRIKAIKVALPQDEFIYTDLLCDFINEFEIDHVFSVAPEFEWKKIYHTVDHRKVRFDGVLTGYLDEATINKIHQMAQKIRTRTIDIGYRAWRAAPWLGRHGRFKVAVAELFERHAPARGFVVDVSTREEDTFFGDAWYEFMLRCKYMIGVEGGASILDRDGAIKKRTEEYMALHPQASFEEVEQECFPNLDGSLSFFPLSPRHLEACATRTCQVLIAGDYNNILIAGKHYIELKRDFSNIDEVLDTLKEDRLRQEITDRAYLDVVESGKYSYRSFIEFITEKSLEGRRQAGQARGGGARTFIAYSRTQGSEAWLSFRLGFINPMRARLRIRTRARNIWHGLRRKGGV
jgi:hypothetical protein